MIYIGADHRGFELKEQLRNRLIEAGNEVFDVGAMTYDQDDDYVDFASAVAHAVQQDPNNIGIVVCGSGVGVDIVANKYDGVRCALVEDVERARQSREHENANVIALPADVLSRDEAWKITEEFLMTKFSSEDRHERRIEKIEQIEKDN